jgi:sigma-B regulation protein RsbU (phosphoserine phosphatase)
MKILLAEDEPVSRVALEATVQQWGFEPVSAEDGHRALELLTSPDPPRIGILDWMMPQLDGTDVCRAVRAASLPIEPYLLILTTRTNRADVVAGLQAGADDYVIKPFDRVELQARLQVGLRVIRLQVQLTDRLRDLEEGRARERSLERMLPICAYCRKIRTDQNYWEMLEKYVGENAGVRFSHGVCPECIGQVEQELATLRSARKRD